MAVVIAGAPTVLELEITVKDFRGQKQLLRIPLLGSVADAGVLAIVDNYDQVSNGMLTANLVARRAVTGMKGAAVNALERNKEEEMELTFSGVNTNGKSVVRSVSVAAMKAIIENIDGSPAAPGVSAALDALVTALAAALAYQRASDSTWVNGLAYDPANSHHYTAGAIVRAL